MRGYHSPPRTRPEPALLPLAECLVAPRPSRRRDEALEDDLFQSYGSLDVSDGMLPTMWLDHPQEEVAELFGLTVGERRVNMVALAHDFTYKPVHEVDIWMRCHSQTCSVESLTQHATQLYV